jgi:hypothetical protein
MVLRKGRNGLLRRCAPLRKRVAFVAGNDAGGARRSPSCIAKNAGSMARDLLKCYAGSEETRFEAEAAQFTHN